MRLGHGIVLGLMMGLCVAVSPLARAEGGRPSRQAMEQMGLGSLVVMSDDDAMAVRGQGFMGGGSSVKVSGNSFATINGPNGGSHSENAYLAEGKHDAKGSNFSFAGVADIWIGGKSGPKDGGGYGGPKDKGGRDYGNMPGSGMPGGGYPGGGMPGGGGGYPGGGVKIHATVFFAGGSSSAWAH